MCYYLGGQEHSKGLYEVLTEIDLNQSRIQWIQSNNGNVPFGAIQGGQTSNGEPLYIGRVWHNGEPCCGKIQPSHQTLYIPYGGKEYTYKQGYEILVFRNRYINQKKIYKTKGQLISKGNFGH